MLFPLQRACAVENGKCNFCRSFGQRAMRNQVNERTESNKRVFNGFHRLSRPQTRQAKSRFLTQNSTRRKINAEAVTQLEKSIPFFGNQHDRLFPADFLSDLHS